MIYGTIKTETAANTVERLLEFDAKVRWDSGCQNLLGTVMIAFCVKTKHRTIAYNLQRLTIRVLVVANCRQSFGVSSAVQFLIYACAFKHHEHC